MATFTDRFRSNFNGVNTSADILWRDDAGDYVLWLMLPSQANLIATLPLVVGPDWHVKAAANFDVSGTGNSDLLWQNDNGALALWNVEGFTVSAIRALPNPGAAWHVVGDNDFNGDFGDDILFQHDNGSLAIWTITSSGQPTISGMFTGTQNPGPTWHVVGSGDTNLDSAGVDSTAGVLWQHNSGALVLWENPTFAASTFTFSTVAALPAVDASWHVKGMQNINDSTADIVFQNDSGAVAIWEMGGAAGTTVTAMNLVNINPGPAWHIVGMREMNGDGLADILFQNDNGAAAVWESYQSLGGGMATFNHVLPIFPNPNPNGQVWDLL